MHFTHLQTTPTSTLLHIFNTAFADYYLPFHLTEAQLLAKMRADKNSPALSVGAFDGDRLVGFILHGVDTVNGQRTVYNGGTGVIPEYRGQGSTARMYAHAIPLLKDQGVDRVILEVISQNAPAIKSYERSGFKALREVACFKGEVQLQRYNDRVEVQELDTLNWQALLPFADVLPTWQNATHVLDAAQADLKALGAFLHGQLVGYLIAHPTNQRLHQIAVHPEHRRQGTGQALLHAWAQKFGHTLSIINVDKRAQHVTGFLTSVGLEVFIEQVEMELEL